MPSAQAASADRASPCGSRGRGGGAGGAERATIAGDGGTAAATGAGAVGGASSSDVPRSPAPPSRRMFRQPQKLVPIDASAAAGSRWRGSLTWAGAEASGGAAAGAGAAGRSSADGATRSPPWHGLPPRPPGGSCQHETPSSSLGGGRGLQRIVPIVPIL